MTKRAQSKFMIQQKSRGHIHQLGDSDIRQLGEIF